MVPDLHSYFDTDINHKNARRRTGLPIELILTRTGEQRSLAKLYAGQFAHKEAVVKTGERIKTVAIAEYYTRHSS